MSKGIGGHHSHKMGKDEWLTPPAIVQALGDFDLDPCSPINRPWPTAKNHYTIIDNGLKKPWEGRVWCNPPYGAEAAVWLGRLADHGDGVALIFARTETDMFFRQVWERATGMLFIRGRLHFHHVTGERAPANSGAPSCLVAYGGNNYQTLANCGIEGQLVQLRSYLWLNRRSRRRASSTIPAIGNTASDTTTISPVLSAKTPYRNRAGSSTLSWTL